MKLFKIITIIVGTCVITGSIFIMCQGLGLQENLDFGAGAYYYADIPNFEKFVNNTYKTEIPMWVHILLFLFWGFLMYKLWCWIDSRKDK
ncbi:MAG: hypothetical protein MJ197_10450 [Bacteroidales bacterium]|nr:hypothetical protein [Bacteroidales bacterium]